MSRLKPPRTPRPDRDSAEVVALSALGFLASEPERLSRFLALTGIEPSRLMEAAGSPEVLVAVLDYLVSDESLLLVFAGHSGVAPETVVAAASLLDPSRGGSGYE